MNVVAPIPPGVEPQPISPPAIVARGEFFALLEAAGRVAEPGSVPLLLVIELAGLREYGRDVAVQRILAEAAAKLLAQALGDEGYVGALRQGRLAVLAASDGARSFEVLASTLLAALARPIAANGHTLTPGATLSAATWGEDGETPEELFVAADQRIHAARVEARSPVPANYAVTFRLSPLRVGA